MAHDTARTERATPRRRRKAREEGSVPRSADLDAAVLIWGNLLLLLGLGGGLLALLGAQVALFLRRAQPGALAEGGRLGLLGEVLLVLARGAGPTLLLSFVLAVGSGWLQVGGGFSAKALRPRFDRLSPAQGFQRLLGGRAAAELLKNLLKVGTLGWVCWGALAPRWPALVGSLALPTRAALALVGDAAWSLARNAMLAMLLLALADLLWQRARWERSIRMTRQEVREEAKDTEGSPEVKQRQRGLMQALARHRMLQAVPKAAVVVTNPTHVAVALRYDADTAAPVCVAKGVDHLALRIRAEARRAGVPILERPDLARALHRAVPLGAAIPRELYEAVAQVLAFVHRLRRSA